MNLEYLTADHRRGMKIKLQSYNNKNYIIKRSFGKLMLSQTKARIYKIISKATLMQQVDTVATLRTAIWEVFS
jgi:hypothetical protein